MNNNESTEQLIRKREELDTIKHVEKYGYVKYVPGSDFIMEHQRSMGKKNPDPNPPWNRLSDKEIEEIKRLIKKHNKVNKDDE